MTLIDDFVQLLIKQDKNLIKIGTGSGYNVWVDKREPTVAYKLEKPTAPGSPNADYTKLTTALGNYNINASATLCRIIEIDSNELQSVLNIYISRVNRIVNPAYINPVRQIPALATFNYKTTGYAVIDFHGMHFGIDEISLLITRNRLISMVGELGKNMAQLHYRSLNDGRDVELLIGRDVENKLIIHVSDFNNTEAITDHTALSTVRNMVNSLKNAPTVKSDKELYDKFVESYLAEADLVGKETEAQRVINELSKRVF